MKHKKNKKSRKSLARKDILNMFHNKNYQYMEQEIKISLINCIKFVRMFH